MFHFGSSVVLDYISDVSNINWSVNRFGACADDMLLFKPTNQQSDDSVQNGSDSNHSSSYILTLCRQYVY